MRSHLQFVSEELEEEWLDESLEFIPGKLVAALLAAELPRYGYHIDFVVDEDWGWHVGLEHAPFRLSIGCAIGLYRENHAHHCFIEPTKPFVRRWFKRIDTSEAVEKLASAIEEIVRANGGSDLEWSSEAEFRSRWG
jgi:hypothetical protein